MKNLNILAGANSNARPLDLDDFLKRISKKLRKEKNPKKVKGLSIIKEEFSKLRKEIRN